MPEGTVKWFQANKGFGFVRTVEKDGKEDIFLHKKNLNNSSRIPKTGEKVRFDIMIDHKNRRFAANLAHIDHENK